MIDQIIYLQANLSSVPWEGNAAAVLPTAPPIPVYYHVLYQGCAETQVSWHGETYCLVGGYRVYGDAAITTPAKSSPEKSASTWVYGDASTATAAEAKAEQPPCTQALKRRRYMGECNEHLGCPSLKIRHLSNGNKDQQCVDG
ncbi:DPEP2 neighbor protein-like isoform X2 [Fukomys damarensis]|uniref:DPEP2 neighbor protein-like isoform X2 n=1 Tax=Fukomys damarensis TaxID=885580 RepID=UPI001455C9E3|nr:DPEP2 neighbor protein-like isoform X2 [Fukomys damarensis]